MKKILSFAAVMVFGITISFAQTAVSNTETATPVIKVSETGNTVKCGTEAKSGSCCSSAKSAATTASASTVATETKTAGACCSGHAEGAEAKSEGAQCKSVSMSVGAAQPEPAKVEDTPEK